SQRYFADVQLVYLQLQVELITFAQRSQQLVALYQLANLLCRKINLSITVAFDDVPAAFIGGHGQLTSGIGKLLLQLVQGTAELALLSSIFALRAIASKAYTVIFCGGSGPGIYQVFVAVVVNRIIR